jgi:DNA-binding SARP family transcriptional activator
MQLSIDGRGVELTAGRLRTLLAVLALTAGESVSVDRLAAAIWDGRLPADARRAVQVYVARLRAELGAELIVTSTAGYLLRAEPGQVDALRFARLLDAAASSASSSAEHGLLVEALNLWRGAPFEDLRSPWLEAAIAPQLVERYLAGTERRIDLDIAAGRAVELAAEVAELTIRHPLREPLWVRRLVVLERCGRRAEALEQYETGSVAACRGSRGGSRTGTAGRPRRSAGRSRAGYGTARRPRGSAVAGSAAAPR